MKKFFILPILLFVLTSCQAKYITPEGERLVRNVAAGCIFGEMFFENCKAGADIIVVGNAIEKNPDLISEISEAIHSF